MTQANVEAAERIYSARMRGDIEAMLAELDPDVEWQPHLAALGGRAVRGHDGVRDYLASLGEEFVDFRQEPEALLDAGDEVVVLLNTYGRGRASGVELELQGCARPRLQGRQVREERDLPRPRRGPQGRGAAPAMSSICRGSSPSGQMNTRSQPASA